MRTLLTLAALSFALSAHAQRAAATPARTTVMELDGDLIEGTADRPDVEPVTAPPKDREHRSLIRVREDFRAEAMQSAGAL
jgi:hypothetical protein